jgi:hypothetical protein
MLSDIFLSAVYAKCPSQTDYTECHYDDYRHPECCGTQSSVEGLTREPFLKGKAPYG